MKVLIKERLSPNKYVTSEGYLICKDAILARTGKQQYRKSEVFDTFDGDDDIIDIDRNPKEVFSDATLASFENKPITVEHPQENVDSTNWKQYQVGFVRDVKRDVVDGQDVILGTLVIQDKDTIDEILNGEHTDLSCGYECDITGDDKTGYSQINIRGNHVALCQEGRAGIARIVDSKVEDDVHTYYSTIRNQKFKIKGLPNHRIKMIYEDGKEEEKKESYFKELLQKQIIRIVDSKVEDVKFAVYNEDDDFFGRFDTKEEAKKQIKELKAFDKRQGNPFDEVYRIEVEDSVKDASYKVREVRSGYAVVVRQYWINYGMNAFVDRICYDLDEAKYVRNSLERADKMSFVIIDCNNRAYMIVDSKVDKDMKDVDSSDLTYFEELLERNNIRFRKISRSSYSGLESQFGKIEKLAKRLNLNVRFEKNGSGHFTVDCDNSVMNDALVEEPRAKDELIKALSDYKLTADGKTFTGRTHCQFESTKQFDKPGFDKEAGRIIALVEKIENKYALSDTTYSIGMKNDGTIVAVVDLGRKYIADTNSFSDSIKKATTLVGLTKIYKIIKNNKDNK